MNHEEQFDDIRVVSINAGTDGGADITIEYNAKRISVSIFASSPEDNTHDGTSVEDELIRLLNQAVDAADEDYEDLMNNALDRILDLAGATFSDVAPRICASQQASTVLHTHLCPDTFDFRLQTIDGKVSISQISPDETLCVPDTDTDPHFHTDFEPDDHLPFFSSDEIYILESFGSGNGIVSKVQVGSINMLCKARRVGLQDIGLEQELKRLQTIRNKNLNTDLFIRVPRLLGYVKHAHSGAIIGLLREWIQPSPLGQTLRDVDVSAVSVELRRHWATQIRQTVDQLHTIDVVWGDGKPSNVIIDTNDDAWLLDFVGGWSYAWVDEELADTVAGDDQAVEKIIKYLGL